MRHKYSLLPTKCCSSIILSIPLQHTFHAPVSTHHVRDLQLWDLYHCAGRFQARWKPSLHYYTRRANSPDFSRLMTYFFPRILLSLLILLSIVQVFNTAPLTALTLQIAIARFLAYSFSLSPFLSPFLSIPFLPHSFINNNLL
jgi:hypothetical protein